jgi:guanine deaminase
MDRAEHFLREAVRLAYDNVRRGGHPFGAVLARDGEVVATGVNLTAANHDPTAHAEMEAIRAASAALATPDLAGCSMYASGHPCPMCLGAMYMSRIGEAFYAYSNDDGALHGLTTAGVYAELALPDAARRLPMRYRPVRLAGEPDLYALWRATAGGGNR